PYKKCLSGSAVCVAGAVGVTHGRCKPDSRPRSSLGRLPRGEWYKRAVEARPNQGTAGCRWCWLLEDWYVGVPAILQGDRIYEDVCVDSGAVEDVLRRNSTPVHSYATDLNASAKRGKTS